MRAGLALLCALVQLQLLEFSLALSVAEEDLDSRWPWPFRQKEAKKEPADNTSGEDSRSHKTRWGFLDRLRPGRRGRRASSQLADGLPGSPDHIAAASSSSAAPTAPASAADAAAGVVATTTSAAGADVSRNAVPTSTYEWEADFPDPSIATTEPAQPTRPPPVFCPSPDQVKLLASSAPTSGAQGGTAEDCKPEKRLEIASNLENEFKGKWNQLVVDVFSKVESGVYLSIGDWRTGPLLGNWLSHARNVAQVEGELHLVNMALDQGGMSGCQNFQRSLPPGPLRLTCISLAGWLPDEFFENDARIGSCEYNMVLWTKPHILKSAVQASAFPVVLIDTDVILYKDLLRLGHKLLSRNRAKKMITGREKNNQANTGTIYATKETSMPFLEAWAQQDSMCLNGHEGDQSALQHVVHFVPGMREALETFHHKEVGECAIKGQWATHYNCVGRKHFVMEAKDDWHKGLSMTPNDVMQPNQLISMAKNLNVATLATFATDSISTKIANMKEAGDWLDVYTFRQV